MVVRTVAGLNPTLGKRFTKRLPSHDETPPWAGGQGSSTPTHLAKETPALVDDNHFNDDDKRRPEAKGGAFARWVRGY